MSNVIVEAGDYVRDPLDDSIRKVDHVDGETVFMEDGGFMGLAEIDEVLLESEVLG